MRPITFIILALTTLACGTTGIQPSAPIANQPALAETQSTTLTPQTPLEPATPTQTLESVS